MVYTNQRLLGAVFSWRVLAAPDVFAAVLLGPGLNVTLGELTGVCPRGVRSPGSEPSP